MDSTQNGPAAAKPKIMLGRGEYWIVNLFISLTMIVSFVTGLVAAYRLAPEMVPIIIGGCLVLLIPIGGMVLYERLKKVKPTQDYVDERSDACSLKSSRNAFVVALVFLALYMIIGAWKPDSLYRILALHAIFGTAISAYVISYYYYRYAV